jgi:F-type H+-transporting ATPase subunit delta
VPAATEGVDRSYAKALFALAKERGQADAVARELDAAADVFAREPELRAFLGRPWITATVKRNAAAEVAARLEVGTLTRDFLALVAANRRAERVPGMAAAFRELVDDAAGRVRARVRAPLPLGDRERAALAGRLSRVLGGKQVVFEEAVDGALLGGFVAEIGSLLVDGSLDGQLARLRERLARG